MWAERAKPQREPPGVGEFWACLSQRVIGATLVAARDRNGPAGLIGLSASHVTASPPTMLVSIDHRTSAIKTILQAQHFSVNFIDADDRATVDRFAPESPFKGADRFEPARWSQLATGAPVFGAALGVFDCELADVVERPSVSILFGNVVACRRRDDGHPLVFFRGDYLAL